MKNISKEKYEKLRNYLIKIKESNEVVLGKWLFASIKGQICLAEGYLGNQEEHMEVEYPLHQKLFSTLLIQIKEKLFFSKRAVFNEVSNPQTFYLSKIGPAEPAQLPITLKLTNI